MGNDAERDATDVWEEPDDDVDDPRDPRIAALVRDTYCPPDGGDTLDHFIDDLTNDDDDGGEDDGD